MRYDENTPVGVIYRETPFTWCELSDVERDEIIFQNMTHSVKYLASKEWYKIMIEIDGHELNVYVHTLITERVLKTIVNNMYNIEI
jgi:hypothetical protein